MLLTKDLTKKGLETRTVGRDPTARAPSRGPVPNPKLQTPNPKSRTTETRTRNHESRTMNHEAPAPAPLTPNHEPDPQFQTRKLTTEPV